MDKNITFDPDTVPTLHLVKKFDSGLAIYDVDESQESRKNMREIINTHLGMDANPWSLLEADNNGVLTEESKKSWKNRSLYSKQVAFVNGKLAGFSAESAIDYEVRTNCHLQEESIEEDLFDDGFPDPEPITEAERKWKELEQLFPIPEIDSDEVLNYACRVWDSIDPRNYGFYDETIVVKKDSGEIIFYNAKSGLGINSSDYFLFAKIFNDKDNNIDVLHEKGRISLEEFPYRIPNEFDTGQKIPKFSINVDIVILSTPDKTELCIAKKGQKLPLIPLRDYIDRDGKVKIDAMKHDIRPTDLKIVEHIDLTPKQKR